ncbi:hypothetical protein RLIN73S_01731 [Rhodanobacter lindaniclasticus]
MSGTMDHSGLALKAVLSRASSLTHSLLSESAGTRMKPPCCWCGTKSLDSCLRGNDEQTAGVVEGSTAQGARFNANTAFNPPNANELLSTARTGISRAVFGT